MIGSAVRLRKSSISIKNRENKSLSFVAMPRKKKEKDEEKEKEKKIEVRVQLSRSKREKKSVLPPVASNAYISKPSASRKRSTATRGRGGAVKQTVNVYVSKGGGGRSRGTSRAPKPPPLPPVPQSAQPAQMDFMTQFLKVISALDQPVKQQTLIVPPVVQRNPKEIQEQAGINRMEAQIPVVPFKPPFSQSYIPKTAPSFSQDNSQYDPMVPEGKYQEDDKPAVEPGRWRVKRPVITAQFREQSEMQRLAGLTELFPPAPPKPAPRPVSIAEAQRRLSVPYATASSFAESFRPVSAIEDEIRSLSGIPITQKSDRLKELLQERRMAIGNQPTSTSSSFASMTPQ
jgi:hypothetical protein